MPASRNPRLHNPSLSIAESIQFFVEVRSHFVHSHSRIMMLKTSYPRVFAISPTMRSLYPLTSQRLPARPSWIKLDLLLPSSLLIFFLLQIPRPF